MVVLQQSPFAADRDSFGDQVNGANSTPPRPGPDFRAVPPDPAVRHSFTYCTSTWLVFAEAAFGGVRSSKCIVMKFTAACLQFS